MELKNANDLNSSNFQLSNIQTLNTFGKLIFFLSINIDTSLIDSLIHQRADSRSKKNYSPAACGTKTTFTER